MIEHVSVKHFFLNLEAYSINLNLVTVYIYDGHLLREPLKLEGMKIPEITHTMAVDLLASSINKGRTQGSVT